MIIEKHIQSNIFLIIIVLLTCGFPAYANGNIDVYELFKQKRYEEALPYFDSLRTLNPTDYSLNYYTGVCLTETNRFGEKTIQLLQQYESDNAPYDINYFLAKNQHALNNFKIATSFYNEFSKLATKIERKELQIDKLTGLCKKSINPFTVSEDPEIFLNRLNEKRKANKEKVREEEIVEIPAELIDTTINFIISSEIYYSRIGQFKTNQGKKNFIGGWTNAGLLKILMQEVDSLRTEYSKSYSSENKHYLSTKVLDLEQKIMRTKNLSDEKLMLANKLEAEWWKKAQEDEKWKLAAQNDSIRKADEEKIMKQQLPVILPQMEEPADTTAQLTDSTTIQETEPITEVPESTANQVVFKIQIGKYNTQLPESTKKLFKKISVLRKIDQYTDENNYIVYTIGELTNIKDAVKLQNQIRQESVKDAFVIAIKDGKRIPLNEALKLTGQ